MAGLVGVITTGSTYAFYNSFYNKDQNSVAISGKTDTAGNYYGMTAAQLKDKTNFTSSTTANGNVNPNWDFSMPSGTWGTKASGSINSGFPYMCAFYYGCGTKITISIADSSKTYGDSNPSLPTVTLTGSLQAGDSLKTTPAWGTAATTNKDAGFYSYGTTNLVDVLSFGTGNSISDYIITWGSTGLTVNPKALTASIVNTPTRAYDGTVNATLSSSNYSLSGLVSGQSFTVGQTIGTYDAKDVALASSVSATLGSGDFTAASGTKASNYVLPTSASGAATITPKTVALSATKTYDGSTSLTGKVSIVTGVSGETLDYSSATASDANVASTGNYIKTLQLVNSNTAVTDNYALPTLDATNAAVTVTPKPLTMTGTTAAGKTYDGNTNATVTQGTLSGFVTGETVTSTAVGTFQHKNASSTNQVTVVYTLADVTGTGGGVASNYSLANDRITNVPINKVVLSVSGTTANNRVYDGTPDATFSVGTLSGFVAGETVTATASGQFSSNNVGTRTTTAVYSLVSETGANNYSGGLDTNYSLPNTTGLSAVISPKPLAIEGLYSADKVYNGNTAAAVNGTPGLRTAAWAGTGATTDGYPYRGDTINITGTAVGNFSDANVSYNGSGTVIAKTVTFTGLGVDNPNYTVTTNPTTTSKITPKALTISGLHSVDKVYDATTGATVTGAAVFQATEAAGTGTSSDGKFYTGDNVSLTGTAVGTFDSKLVASASAVAFTGLSLTGAQAGNYTLTQHSNEAHVITPKALTISGLSSVNKVYDGNTSATVNGTATLQTDEAAGAGSSTDGKFYTNDSVSLTGTVAGNFNTKDVTTANAVAFTGLSLTGSEAGNYTLTQHANATGRAITPKALSVTGTTAAGRTYDATTNAAITVGTISGFIGSERVTATAAGTFDSKNAGSRTATAVYTLANGSNGGLAGNYSLANTTSLTATVTAKALTISGLSSVDKVYDATTTATVNGTAVLKSLEAAGTGTSSDGKAFTGDTVSLTGTAVGNFNSKRVASANTVAFTGLSLTGGDAANYTLTQHSNEAHVITPKALTISGLSSVGKVYDATTTATVNGSAVLQTFETAGAGASTDGKAYTNDTVSLTGTVVGNFNTKDVTTAKSVAFTGLSLTGSEADNYTLTQHADATGLAITPKVLTVSGTTAATKVYDGNTTATITVGSLSGFASSESVSASASGTFDSKNAGSRSTTATYTLADGSNGGLASNYQLADTTQSATIEQRALTITGTSAANKTYDGNTTAVITPGTLNNLVGGETLSVSAVGSYDSKNAGARTATAVYTLADGSGMVSNYLPLANTTHAATIDKRALTITGTSAANKTYDGNTTATLSVGTLNNLVSGESLQVSAVGTFDSKNAGARTVTAVYTLADGSGQVSNYLPLVSTKQSATIDQRALLATGFAVKDKVFTGSTDAELILTGVGLSNTVAGDDVKLVSPATGQFDNANVGNDKPVLVAGLGLAGLDAGNYKVTGHSALTGNVLPAPSSAVSVLTTTQPSVNGANVSASTATSVVVSQSPVTDNTLSAAPAAASSSSASTTSSSTASSSTSTATAPVVSAPSAANAVAVIPSQGSMSLSNAAGGASSLALTQVGDLVTLSVGAAAAAGAGAPPSTAAVTTPALPVFKVTTVSSAPAESTVKVTDQGASMSASSASANETGLTATAALASGNAAGAGLPTASVKLTLGNGANVDLSVSVTSDGVLVVRLPEQAVASANEKSVTLLALTAAKENLGTQTESIRGVLILPAQ